MKRSHFDKPLLKRVIERLPPLARFIATEADSIATRAECAPIAVAGSTPSLLCLHGFTGVPHEVRLGCEVAEALGLSGYAPLLPGHGTSSLDLAGTTFEDWLAGARQSFDRLRARGPVILLGLSMGSLLATQLALEAPGDVQGLILLSNAFWLKSPYPTCALELVDRLSVPNLRLRKNGADLGDPAAQRSHVTYPAEPIHGGVEVLRAGQRLRQRLGDVHRPTLILHGAQDRVCPVRNAWRAAQLLGTRSSRVVIFPRSHHILTRDSEREQVRQEIERFVRDLVAQDGQGL